MKSAKSLERSWQRWKGSWEAFMNKLDRDQVPYMSHSKVTTVERCPRCYYRQYVLREKLDGDWVVVGNLFHKAARFFYGALASGVEPPGMSKLMKQLPMRRLTSESKAKLRNALKILRDNRWKSEKVICVEEPFFMELARGLPPVIGVPDLVLSRDAAFVVVDHKTTKAFKDLDSAQLVLYAEHLRRDHDAKAIVGVFDEYRLVPELSKTRKPVFRRMPVSVDRLFLPSLIQRYRKAWKQIANIQRHGEPSPSHDCWQCSSFGYWS